MSNPSSRHPSDDRLESWKEIAAYLKKDIRTVQRWEKRAGLPVYRDPGREVANVYARRGEIDAWIESRFRPAPPPVSSPVARHSRLVIAAAVCLAAGVAAARIWTLREPKSGQVQLRRIWPDLNGSQQYGLVSRDGRVYSFGMRQIGLHEVATGDQHWLTPQFEIAPATYSAPSPDGKHVAFIWPNPADSSVEMRLAHADGSNPETLFRATGVQLRPWEWSAGGDSILATAVRGRSSQILLIPVNPAPARVLATFESQVDRASLSPDGRYLVYARDGGLFVSRTGVDTSSTPETPLVRHAGRSELWGWVPGSDRVLFSSDRSGGRDAWMVKFREGLPHDEPELIRRDVGNWQPVGFSHNGSFFYVEGRGKPNSNLYTAKLDADGRLLDEPNRVEDRFAGSVFSGDWSPDGESIAYLSDRPQRHVVIRPLSGGRERVLPAFDFVEFGLKWAGDGASLVSMGPANGREGVVLLEVQTGTKTLAVPLTGRLWPDPTAEIANPIFAADGAKVFYLRRAAELETSRLLFREMRSGREQVIDTISHPARHEEMDLSRDSQWIAVTTKSSRRGDTWLHLIPATGGSKRALWRVEDIDSIAWTPDSSQILCSVREPEEHPEGRYWFRLWRVPIDGRPPVKTELVFRQIIDIRLHPDGRRVAFRSGGTRLDLWVMENYLPAR